MISILHILLFLSYLFHGIENETTPKEELPSTTGDATDFSNDVHSDTTLDIDGSSSPASETTPEEEHLSTTKDATDVPSDVHSDTTLDIDGSSSLASETTPEEERLSTTEDATDVSSEVHSELTLEIGKLKDRYLFFPHLFNRPMQTTLHISYFVCHKT
ncbi:unnamed protein product [Dibothriocephalus latus]|uniref:Uncharacterized protein n=1 Tax=Dibothriocephalus latus TaxID=60516 RepID=A0A3P7LZ39_DIBLA|nr:unnamed protein product [Dibothriocephalus latus]